MVCVRRLLLLTAVLAGLFVASLPGTAGAAAPCRNKVFNDWYQDGKVASTYPIACYRDALKHIPVDAGIYSSLSDDIRAAMRAAIRRSEGLSAPRVVGKGFPTSASSGSGAVKGKVVQISNSEEKETPKGTNVTAAPPVADTSSSSGPPLPILVLGAIAILLVAAGAVGLGVRHARGRANPS
jgi:hypothetical protein